MCDGEYRPHHRPTAFSLTFFVIPTHAECDVVVSGRQFVGSLAPSLFGRLQDGPRGSPALCQSHLLLKDFEGRHADHLAGSGECPLSAPRSLPGHRSSGGGHRQDSEGPSRALSAYPSSPYTLPYSSASPAASASTVQGGCCSLGSASVPWFGKDPQRKAGAHVELTSGIWFLFRVGALGCPLCGT